MPYVAYVNAFGVNSNTLSSKFHIHIRVHFQAWDQASFVAMLHCLLFSDRVVDYPP